MGYLNINQKVRTKKKKTEIEKSLKKYIFSQLNKER
jgi:hypothetical protein